MENPEVQSFLIDKLYLPVQCQGVNIDPQDIPVYVLKDSWPIRYHSPIALKLAKISDATRNPKNPLEIATQILQRLSFQNEWIEIRVHVMPSGMIEFELTDRAIAVWLEKMTETPLPFSSFPPSSPPVLTENHYPNLFTLQYSHARCCSLLRLADRDRIITLAEPHLQTTPPLWSFLKPDPIPWLDLNQNLQLDHDSEQQLISQLLTTLDASNTASDQKFWKNRVDLISDRFQAFYRQCRIWGEVKLKTPEKAQTRLGLIAVTQAMLRYILEEKLGVVAPLEL